MMFDEAVDREPFTKWLATRRESSDDQWSSWKAAKQDTEASWRSLNQERHRLYMRGYNGCRKDQWDDSQTFTEIAAHVTELQAQLAAETKRRIAAEKFLGSLGWDTAENCEASYEMLNEYAMEACIAWQLTLPAEEKE